MAASNRIEESTFECTICLESFVEPKFLPCFHTFCKICLSTHIKKSTKKRNVFPCPVCRKNTMIPDKGADGFQSNFYVLAAATSEAVMKNKLIESLSAANNVASEDRKLFEQPCPKHGSKNQVLQFYCIPCDMPICVHCKLTAHEGHDTRDLEDIIHRTKEELNGLCDTINSYLCVYKGSNDKVCDFEKKTDHKLQTLKASVIGNAEELHDMIDNRKKVLLNVISKNQKKEANNVVQYKKDLEKNTRQMTDIINSISKEQNKHDVMSLLKLRTTVVDRMKKINPVPPVYNTQVEDIKYERPEYKNAKAKNVVNSFLGQIKIDQANGTVHINGQPMAAGIDLTKLILL